MNIALCGAGGTGKGTFAEFFCTIHDGFEFLRSPVEEITNLMLPEARNYQDMTFPDKIKMQYATLTSEMSNELVMLSFGYQFVAERSVFDFLPYMYQALHKKYGTDTMRIEIEYGKYERYVYHYLKEKEPYDALMFFPIEFEPKDKEVNFWKERDESARKETETFLREHLDFELLKKNYGIEIFEVSGSIEQRLDQAWEFLNQK